MFENIPEISLKNVYISSNISFFNYKQKNNGVFWWGIRNKLWMIAYRVWIWKWTCNTSVEEIEKFIEICLQMGLVRLSKLRDYWSSRSAFFLDMQSLVMWCQEHGLSNYWIQFIWQIMINLMETASTKSKVLFNCLTKWELYTWKRNIHWRILDSFSWTYCVQAIY